MSLFKHLRRYDSKQLSKVLGLLTVLVTTETRPSHALPVFNAFDEPCSPRCVRVEAGRTAGILRATGTCNL